MLSKKRKGKRFSKNKNKRFSKNKNKRTNKKRVSKKKRIRKMRAGAATNTPPVVTEEALREKLNEYSKSFTDQKKDKGDYIFNIQIEEEDKLIEEIKQFLYANAVQKKSNTQKLPLSEKDAWIIFKEQATKFTIPLSNKALLIFALAANNNLSVAATKAIITSGHWQSGIQGEETYLSKQVPIIFNPPTKKKMGVLSGLFKSKPKALSAKAVVVAALAAEKLNRKEISLNSELCNTKQLDGWNMSPSTAFDPNLPEDYQLDPSDSKTILSSDPKLLAELKGSCEQGFKQDAILPKWMGNAWCCKHARTEEEFEEESKRAKLAAKEAKVQAKAQAKAKALEEKKRQQEAEAKAEAKAKARAAWEQEKHNQLRAEVYNPGINSSGQIY